MTWLADDVTCASVDEPDAIPFDVKNNEPLYDCKLTVLPVASESIWSPLNTLEPVVANPNALIDAVYELNEDVFNFVSILFCNEPVADANSVCVTYVTSNEDEKFNNCEIDAVADALNIACEAV